MDQNNFAVKVLLKHIILQIIQNKLLAIMNNLNAKIKSNKINHTIYSISSNLFFHLILIMLSFLIIKICQIQSRWIMLYNNKKLV